MNKKTLNVFIFKFKLFRCLTISKYSFSTTYQSHKESYNNDNKKQRLIFEPHLTSEEFNVLLQKGELLKGQIRVFPHHSIVTTACKKEYRIRDYQSRNRALHNDLVAIKPKKSCQEYGIKHEKHDQFQVVRILKENHSRVVVGKIKPAKAFGLAMLYPIDKKVPLVAIPLIELPLDFLSHQHNYRNTLFLGKITHWDHFRRFADGKFLGLIGESGCIKAESEAILQTNAIDLTPFPNKIIRKLPNASSWQIPFEELKTRVDLRKECIFSIDPLTARDLDDALSCKKIGEDIYEVGVHIADVSYFVQDSSDLDKIAQKRANSVYLTDKVIPMLPKVLSENLCSLNPSVDRLTFSVIWNINSDGTILNEWIGRTIIQSCMKMTYDQAQKLIDTKNNDLNKNDFPEIFCGFKLEDIYKNIRILHKLSQNLRKKRIESGAMNIDIPKLSVVIDKETGQPIDIGGYEYRDSNKLIEEFMLLANISVARKINSTHPKKAILRRHPPPSPSLVKSFSNICQLYGLDFDPSNNESVTQSFKALSQLPKGKKEYLEAALMFFYMKSMLLASYFCAGSVSEENYFHHFGLNVPLYTHFTSPIRRYPDIIVHRLLTASLQKNSNFHKSINELEKLAVHCNEKNYAAKLSSEQSALLYFTLYVSRYGPIEVNGVVVNCQHNAFDVLLIKYGLVKRVFCDDLPLLSISFENETSKCLMILHWKSNNDKEKNTSEEICMFSPVIVILNTAENQPSRLVATLKNPFDDVK